MKNTEDQKIQRQQPATQPSIILGGKKNVGSMVYPKE